MRLAAQIVKELLSYFRDPQQRIPLFGPPLIQLLVLSSAGDARGAATSTSPSSTTIRGARRTK